MMPTCCMQSFVFWGIAEQFRLAVEGEEHQYETCGRVYVMNKVWTLKEE